MSVSPVDPGALSLAALALQAQLQLAFPPKRFQFGFMPPRMSTREWTMLVNRPPFVGLGWNDMKADQNGSKLFKGKSSWTVYLVVDNASGVQGRYLGDAQGPGLFQLVQAAIIVLNGYKIPQVGSCLVERAANAFAADWDRDGLAMAAVDVTVNLALDVPSGLTGVDATPDLLRQIATSWVFPGDGGGTQIQDVSQFAPEPT